ncbi:HlyD family secretion protein [Luteitalea sp.]|jgi:HlyD family secretion protein|uniref:HlyD family secretion protein n=1 Tax=Luteitalea sp. TaxID=2004800 RepID=UPI0037C99E6E
MPDVTLSPAERRRRRWQRWRVPALIGALVIGGTLGVMRLAPASPSVDGSPLWFDTVQRGELVREVRGTGSLVPVDTAWIPAATDGRVGRILLRPGASVESDDVILELQNSALQQEVIDTGLQLAAAEARLTRAGADATTTLLAQEALVARTEAEYEEARADADADAALRVDGLVSDLQHRRSSARARSLQAQVAAERKRLDVGERMRPSQLAEQQAEVSRMRALLALKQEQLGLLHVRAGMRGVLQAVPVEVGSQVTAGTNVARVADPSQLKAQVRVPETQARDVQVGQVARVDTRAGVTEGRVSRVDPAAVSGTVLVDITIVGEMPRGARPDLSVDGVIEIERLVDVLYMSRPSQGPEGGTISVFRTSPGGMADRQTVRLGKGSVRHIQVVDGLREGDRVVLSDMSDWDQVDRIRIR